MKRFGKRLLSLLLALCLTFSIVVASVPTASAGIGTAIGKAIGKKALELGMRAVLKVSTELASQAEDDDALIVLQSFVNYILLDAQGVTINKISAMCEDILAELAELEENVKEYTAVISSAIDKQNLDQKVMQFSNKWSEDVTSVVEDYSVDKALNIYLKHLIVSNLHTNGMPSDSGKLATLKSFWKSHFGSELTEESYSEENRKKIKEDLEKAFIEIYDSTNGMESKDAAYKSAHIFNQFKGAITELTDNFVYESVAGIQTEYSVIESAATDAYFTLPFSYQQYEFVNSTAKHQIMNVNLLQMALNEYLSMQGQYLQETYSGTDKEDSWYSENILTYVNEGGTSTATSYKQCKAKYQEIIENTLDESSALLESEIDINTLPYTGSTTSIKLTLSDYMQPEDAVAVKLSISGHESTYDYGPEIEPTEADDSMELGDTVVDKKHINSELTFYRVMSGSGGQEVYYILDPNQFSDADALDVHNFREHIKRYGPTGGSDSLYGDLYPVSVDYRNLIKPMSDGTNTFSVPKDKQLTDEFANLVKVPYFSAVSGFNLQDYLKGFLPTGALGSTYILSSGYSNNFNSGGNTAVKSATIKLVNTGNILDNTYAFETDDVGMEDLSNNLHKYGVILTNDSDTYSQTAAMKVQDSANSITDAYINYGGSTISKGKSGAIESGSNISIKFKLKDKYTFDSLVMVRHNAKDTETVLMDADDFKAYLEADSNGYYTFNTKMPYSKVDFILNTKTYNSYTASAKKEDRSNAVNNFYIDFDSTRINLGSSGKVAEGEEISLSFSLKNVNAFDSLVAVNCNTQEKTTILSKDEIKRLEAKDGYYTIATTMPSANTDFVLNTVAFDVDEDGNFIIRTYEDLCSMATNVNSGNPTYTNGTYYLANDITVPDSEMWSNPIGLEKIPFSGKFYGQGHSITGLKYTGDSDRRVALFEYAKDATIKDLNLKDIYFNVSNRSASGFCAVAENCNFINCSVSGSITSSHTGQLGHQSAGLIAFMDNGTIEGCTNYANITDLSTGATGGIVGHADEIIVNKCINRGDIITSGSDAGGICGFIRYGSVNNCGNIGDIECNTEDTYSSDCAGVAVHYESQITNCYNVGDIKSTAKRTSAVSQNTRSPFYYSSNSNCYYLEGTVKDSDAKPKTQREFSMGEVAYLLNNGVTDGTQAWYQSLDNGKLPNLYPQLVNEDSTVYVIPENRGYSNYQHSSTESILQRVDTRSYRRILDADGKFTDESKITLGYAIMDNKNKVITLYTLPDTQRVGVLMNQGIDGATGVVKLKGDYPVFKETSKEILSSKKEEPDIYTDGNGCIFIKMPQDGSEIPDLTLGYTTKPTGDYKETLYTLKIKTADLSMFRTLGARSVTRLSANDPDYVVLHGDEDKPSNPSGKPDTPQTGDTVLPIALFAVAIISLMAAAILIYRKKSRTC